MRSKNEAALYFLKNISMGPMTATPSTMSRKSPRSVRTEASSIRSQRAEGRFQVDRDRRLGGGSFGSVYSGIDRETGEPIAVKEFSDRGAYDEELRNARGLDCGEAPIQCVLGSEVVGGRGYIAYRLANGDIQALFKSGAPVDPDVAFRLLNTLVKSIAYLRENDLVHRDIKPDNVLYYGTFPDVHFSLGDLGSVCSRKGKNKAVTKCTSKMRTTQAFTPATVAAAEEYEDDDAMRWVDLYGMAATMYYYLTGGDIPSMRRPPTSMPEGYLDPEIVKDLIDILGAESYRPASKAYHALKEKLNI